MSKAILIANELYNEYKPINEKVKYINHGGCGIFAEHLYCTLIKLGLNPSLGVITRNAKGMMERIIAWRSHNGVIAESIYEVNHGCACVDHVVVILEGKIIDSEGVYNSYKEIKDGRYSEYEITDTLCLKVLRSWNNEGNFWNWFFDRSNIKLIEKKLEDCYKKVKKNLEIPN